jgi:2-polyprenyl-3-methyl-5-hydroxy-6-metoxy-1,4-benzoquinol methylase
MNPIERLPMKPRESCAACASKSFTRPFILEQQPVVLNYRFPDAAAAANVNRRDITLVQCQTCGLVFNSIFDLSVIPYNENYENRQDLSPAFSAHVNKTIADLIQRYGLAGQNILEVGCGNGEFLRALCRAAGARGTGYDTSHALHSDEEDHLKFFQRYVSAKDIAEPFAAVICRHVLGHVPEIGAFLRELHAIAQAAGDPVILLETPRFEWIAKSLSLWDLFYEYCNYFPADSLSYACKLAGFRVIRQRSVFGGQYQILELKVARTLRKPRAPGIPPRARLIEFAEKARVQWTTLAATIEKAASGKPWAVWGAGAKGVTLVNNLPGAPPICAIDSNPRKQGGVLPGTWIPIVSPDDPLIDSLKLILIANPIYVPEIRETLRQRGFSGRIAVL